VDKVGKLKSKEKNTFIFKKAFENFQQITKYNFWGKIEDFKLHKNYRFFFYKMKNSQYSQFKEGCWISLFFVI